MNQLESKWKKENIEIEKELGAGNPEFDLKSNFDVNMNGDGDLKRPQWQSC